VQGTGSSWDLRPFEIGSDLERMTALQNMRFTSFPHHVVEQ
jgi:hypothetical protein